MHPIPPSLLLVFLVGCVWDWSSLEGICIPELQSELVVDGETSDWSVEANSLSRTESEQSAPVDDADLSADWRATWSEDALFLLIGIRDDALVSGSEGDRLTVLLDRSGAAAEPERCSSSAPDLVLSVGATNTSVFDECDLDVSPIEMANVQIGGTARNVEMRIPWQLIQSRSLFEGDRLHIDVHVTDDDGQERDKRLSWFEPSGRVYEDGSSLGPIVLRTECSQ